MNEYTCDLCHKTHNRSRKCLYCGAGARHQQPTAETITPNPSPAPRKKIRATQLEFPNLSPAPFVMTASQRAGMVNFHERAAKAYEASGQAEQAAAARQRADAMKAEAAEVTS